MCICEGCRIEEATETFELYEGVEGDLQFVGMIHLCDECTEATTMYLVPSHDF